MVQYSLEIKDERFPVNVCVRRWTDMEHHNGELLAGFKYVDDARDYIEMMKDKDEKRERRLNK